MLLLGAALGSWVSLAFLHRKNPAPALPKAAIPPLPALVEPPPPSGVTAARRDLLAVVNHEIRTPLNGVIGYTDLLLETPLQPDQRDFAMNIRQSAEVLVALLNDISDYSSLQDGQLELNSSTFNFAETLLSVLDLFASHAGEKGLELAHNLTPGRRLPVLADPARTRQVLLNLLGNAISFTSNGHIVVRVEAAPGPQGFLKCTVSDTGCGMAPEVLARLFAKTGQGQGVITRRYGTDGIGLSISKNLVELMGGRIGVESRPGPGSEFWFQLPLIEEHHKPESAPPGQTSTSRDARVLVIEPTSVSCEMLVNHFSAGAFSVELADHGQGALDRLRQATKQGLPFATVVFAEKLSDQSGRDLARAIRTDSTLSGLGLVCLRRPGAHPASATELTALGVVDIVKPVLQSAALLNAVRVAATLQACTAPTEAIARSEDIRVDKKPASLTSANGHALVVEDNELNQRVLTEMLKRAGWDYLVVDNGAEAVRLACLESYDLILMDCHLPELDGFNATRQIRQNEMATRMRRTPVVAVTAESLADSRERCLAAGMDDCLTKPLRRAELEETLRRYARVGRGKSGQG